MQTIQLKVNDDSLGIVMTLVENLKTDITKEIKIIDNDSEEDRQKKDPYLHERQKELHQLRAKIKDGDMEMLSQERYEQEIEQFFEHIEK